MNRMSQRLRGSVPTLMQTVTIWGYFNAKTVNG